MKHYTTVYDQARVKSAINNLAQQVTNIIETRGTENCVFLTVLEGGMFLSNKIIEQLPPNMLSSLTTACIKVSSYKGDQKGYLTHEYIPNIDCSKKTLIIVDDFCDSGSTINALQTLYTHRFDAKEIIFVTLLARKKRSILPEVELLYGIEDNTNNFYFGCGMDEDNKGRFIDRIITIDHEAEKE